MEYFKKYEPLFGAWYITRLIGEGSFGKVFEIERKDFGKTYKAAMKAITIPQNRGDIKNLTMSGIDNESVTTYFQSLAENVADEFAIMSSLKGNSNIVSYEDHTVIKHNDGIGWDILIRMELLTPADDFFAQNGFETDKIIKLGIDLCKALEVCQKRNIIHRDIKPANIFVSDNGDFKLGDFGVAKTIEQTTGEFSKKGTYNYMAPEVYRGETYGNSVDLYSVGIVMYRYLNNNRTPFSPQPPEMITYNKSEEALTRRMKGEELPSPVNAGGELAQIVLKACRFDPANRYSSPVQMRRELEKLLTVSEPEHNIFESTVYQPTVGAFKKNADAVSPPIEFTSVTDDEFDKSISNEDNEIPTSNGNKKKTVIICVVCAAILALIVGGAFLLKNSSLGADLRSVFSDLSSSTLKNEETTENADTSTSLVDFSNWLYAELTTAESTTQIMFVKTGGSDLNMREAADINSAVVTKIPKGYPVYVLKTESDWAYIEFAYQNGWVKAEFLVDIDELDESTTAKVAFTTRPVITTAATTRKPTTTRKITTTKNPTTTAKTTTTKRITTTVDSLSNYDYVNEWANLKIKLPYGYIDQTDLYHNTYGDDMVVFAASNNNQSGLTVGISADIEDDISAEQWLALILNEYISSTGESNIQNLSEISYAYLGDEKYCYAQWEDYSTGSKMYSRFYIRKIGNKFISINPMSPYISDINMMVGLIESVS